VTDSPSWIQEALLLRLLLPRREEWKGGRKVKGREGREGPREIVHPEKFLRISPEVWHALSRISQFYLPPTRSSANGMNHALEFPTEAGPHFTDLGGTED